MLVHDIHVGNQHLQITITMTYHEKMSFEEYFAEIESSFLFMCDWNIIVYF